jgi:hypothetical protein
VAADTGGRGLVTHWFHYLMIAREARDRATEIMSANPDMIPSESLIAIVMSALTVEAFINELGEAADMEGIRRENMTSPTLDMLRGLAKEIAAVEASRGSTASKYQAASQVLSGYAFPRGLLPFQDLQKLLSLRDLLVHLRPGDQVEADGNIVPRINLIRSFQQAGLTRTRDRRPGHDVPGGMSWLNEIETAAMATWAYAAACGIIRAIGRTLPQGGIPTPIIDMFRFHIQNLRE